MEIGPESIYFNDESNDIIVLWKHNKILFIFIVLVFIFLSAIVIIIFIMIIFLVWFAINLNVHKSLNNKSKIDNALLKSKNPLLREFVHTVRRDAITHQSYMTQHKLLNLFDKPSEKYVENIEGMINRRLSKEEKKVLLS